jgi:hypothetical protein
VASPKAALGLRAHSGWAAMVAIAGLVDSPSVIDRRVIQLCNPKTRGSKQPYHAAEPLPFRDAEKFISRCIGETHEFAHEGLCAALSDLQNKGHRVVGCGVLLGSGRTLPSLEGILASHAMIHAAEGDLFRNALVATAARCKLPVIGVRERELFSRAGEILARSEDDLRDYLSEVGHSLGPPWREDQKCAMLAAWMALAVKRSPDVRSV